MTPPARTRIGGFALGLRRGRSAWQRDLPAWLWWTREHGFAHVDLGDDADSALPAVEAAGMAIGSVDLPRWRELLSPDPGRRAAAVDEARAYASRCLDRGVRRFLVVLVPEDPARSRRENFATAVESYGVLLPDFEAADAAIVLEGWPGPGALGCTPETLRALFRELPSPALGINFDPSHLLRQGIDLRRFIDEFAPRLLHAHAKDTALLPDRAYDLGTEQPPTFAVPRKYEGSHWRYTIPGEGGIDWDELLARLAAAGFNGRMSLELEDANHLGTEATEQAGLLRARDFLARPRAQPAAESG